MSDDQAQRRPARFPPPFASVWGDDEFGLWAEFEVTVEGKPIRQKMRWIEPGTFWMGSPEKEDERMPNEGPRHLVTLTDGFWLADTACTQALWAAVMGSNPSHFEGEQLPVESVSWHDAQAFLLALRERFVDAEFELPTEAQWEYACRAATETPFSSSENITSDEVNYDGNYPYAGGPKGQYRLRTVEVCSLPPNSWGLYEMHGNVWEWCLDGPRQYGDELISDPVGPLSAALRTLRGGSWAGYGGYVRCASRREHEPGRRDVHLGFRVCSTSKKISRDG